MQVRTILFLLLSGLTALLLAACAPMTTDTATDSGASDDAASATVTVIHPQGETTVVKNPATVVVFNYSALDTLDVLGIPVAGVPQGPSMPPHLQKYNGEEYAGVGSTFEPDAEAVNALDPDLIIVGLRSAAVYDDMAKIAPTIDVTVDWAQKLEAYRAYMDNLAVIFDKEAEVNAHLENIDARIAEVQTLAEESGKTALVILTTGGELSGYGPGSRFGLVHDLLHVAPATEGLATEVHGDAISYEFILEQNPDILYVLDRDATVGDEGESAARMLDNEIVNATTAARNGNIVYLNGPAWYMADSGMTMFPAMIDDVAAGLELAADDLQ
ncbi:MAG: siderophore ABC transporter substrate-binding protein [Caldilineaceae bacterium]|nr:siderophore ABC transporter substrate-binding protein [Caldilineaceae bacterium]